MPAVMEFGLLGPLMVRGGESVVPVRRGHQRTLLAGLLLEANRVVSTEAIAEALWGATPPPSAPATIRNYIKRLRQALSSSGPQRIRTHPRGYLIHAAEGELDLARFEDLLAAARTSARNESWEAAAAQAQQALALWRGEPLADIESEVLRRREVPRLTELRLQAMETRLEAELHRGAHAQVVAELQRLAAAHPFREHLHALLMLALYRCGRQADALAAYQRARVTLVEELGSEPGIELRTMHQQILATDPALAAAPPRSSVAAGGPGGEAAGAPHQLPATTAHFTGRTVEIAALTRMLDGMGGTPGTAVICAIGGTAGVGKTTLAVYWAHQVAHRFRDGHLYVNLRGFGPTGPPAVPAEVVRGFLNALGVAPERIPPDLETMAGLYRSLVAGRRMLIVLDNARDEQQVRPLLPASPGTLVIVTSRSQLAGLTAADGAYPLTLGIFTDAEAGQMLRTRLGDDRVAAEPGAVSEITRLCGYLPLGLAIAAARAQLRPHLPLSALAVALRDRRSRLDTLDCGDPAASIRAVFSWSYQQLGVAAARLFRLLGLHPGPDISVAAAASLMGSSRAEARLLLAELSRAHLIAEHSVGRYALHDLLRVYAAEQAEAACDDAGRQEALGRVLDHYLHAARAAALSLAPSREAIAIPPARAGVTVEHPAGYQEALAWFEAEHDVMLAVIALAAGPPPRAHAWQLPWAMADFLNRRGHWREQAAIQRIALTAATQLDDLAGQAQSLRLLANACCALGDYDDAVVHLGECLTRYRRVGDRAGEARVHQALSFAAEHQQRYRDALDHAEQGLRLFQAIGNRAGQAQMLNNVGWCHALLGDYRQARAVCAQALALICQTGDRDREGHIWDSLGFAEHHLGHHGRAAACYLQALRIFRRSGDRLNEAEALTHLGDAYGAAGQPSHAQDAWRQALAILRDLHHCGADQVRARLAGRAPAR